ncbi:MAG TPA: SMI1/KNR4 family protein [Kofleriaceae bacterium]|nr:SMI1/KNR4 family protein [Kofleriaceae bacterium]
MAGLAERLTSALKQPDGAARFRALVDGLPDGKLAKADAEAVLGLGAIALAGFAGTRGDREAERVIAAVLARLPQLPKRGYHFEQFVRNALGVVGPERLPAVERLVPATVDEPAIHLNLACARAAAGDRRGVIAAIERGLAAGMSRHAFANDPELAAMLATKQVAALLSPPKLPAIAWDVAPHVARLSKIVQAFAAKCVAQGDWLELGHASTKSAIVAVEKQLGVPLPNDFRAFLTLHDGLKAGHFGYGHRRVSGDEILGLADLGGGKRTSDTQLAKWAREWLDGQARHGSSTILDCVPLATFTQTSNWVLYDPIGHYLAEVTGKRARPGYIMQMNADAWIVPRFADALRFMFD